MFDDDHPRVAGELRRLIDLSRKQQEVERSTASDKWMENHSMLAEQRTGLGRFPELVGCWCMSSMGDLIMSARWSSMAFDSSRSFAQFRVVSGIPATRTRGCSIHKYIIS